MVVAAAGGPADWPRTRLAGERAVCALMDPWAAVVIQQERLSAHMGR
jgi:hypothetical protein